MAQSPRVDIAQLVAEFRNVGAAETAARAELDAAQGKMNESTNLQVDSIRREAALTGQVQAAIDQLTLKKVERNQRSAAEFGTNQDANSYVLAEMAQRQMQTAEELQMSAQEIQAADSVGFSDDPLAWIVNQFTRGRRVAAHNAKVAEQEVVENTIAKLQAQTESSIRINNSISDTTSRDVMALNAERLKAAAEKEVARAQHDAAKTNIQVASVRLATNQQQFQNVLSLNRAIIDLQQISLQQANLSLAREEREERLKMLKERHESDKLLQEDLNRATAVLGYRQLTPMQYKNMSGPTKAAIEAAMASPDIAAGRLGPDPVVAVQNAQTVNAPLTPQKQQVKEALSGMMITGQENTPAWQSLKPEQKHALQLKEVTSTINRQLRNIPDQGSIFSAPPLKAVGEIPAVAATDLWKNHIAPLAKSSMVPTSAQQLFNIAGEAVFSGKADLNKISADLATTYQAIVADNWHNRDYNTFALKIAPEYRTTYNTRVKLPTLFGGDVVVDMTSETAVKNAMLRYLAAQRSSDAIMRPGAGGGRFTDPLSERF